MFVDEVLQNREVDVVFSDGWLLSVRHSNGAAMAPAGKEALARFERQRGEHGSNDEGFLLWAILDVIVDRYFDVTTAIDERLDDIEDVVFDRTADVIPREIFTLRRSIVAFRRAVGPLREVLAQLLRKEVECIGDEAIAHLQDVYDHTLRVLDLIESQRELLTGLLEGQLAVQSNQMNRVMKATSSWGAILIASTLIAGIYGMNFRHMPELEWAFGYPVRARARWRSRRSCCTASSSVRVGSSARPGRAHGRPPCEPPRALRPGEVVLGDRPRDLEQRHRPTGDAQPRDERGLGRDLQRVELARARQREDQQEDPDHRREQRAAERRDRPGEDVEHPQADDEQHERGRRARFVERDVVELGASRHTTGTSPPPRRCRTESRTAARAARSRARTAACSARARGRTRGCRS